MIKVKLVRGGKGRGRCRRGVEVQAEDDCLLSLLWTGLGPQGEDPRLYKDRRREHDFSCPPREHGGAAQLLPLPPPREAWQQLPPPQPPSFTEAPKEASLSIQSLQPSSTTETLRGSFKPLQKLPPPPPPLSEAALLYSLPSSRAPSAASCRDTAADSGRRSPPSPDVDDQQVLPPETDRRCAYRGADEGSGNSRADNQSDQDRSVSSVFPPRCSSLPLSLGVSGVTSPRPSASACNDTNSGESTASDTVLLLPTSAEQARKGDSYRTFSAPPSMESSGQAPDGWSPSTSKTDIVPAGKDKDRGNRTFMYVLACFATIGGLLFGYDTGIVSGSMLLIKPYFDLSTVWHEIIVSGTIGAAAVFALLAGFVCDFLGRKKTIMIASFIFAAGAVVMAVAPSKEVLLGGRIVVGVGIGQFVCLLAFCFCLFVCLLLLLLLTCAHTLPHTHKIWHTCTLTHTHVHTRAHTNTHTHTHACTHLYTTKIYTFKQA